MSDAVSDPFTITIPPATVSDPFTIAPFITASNPFTITDPIVLDFGIPVGVSHPYRLRQRRFPRW